MGNNKKMAATLAALIGVGVTAVSASSVSAQSPVPAPPVVMGHHGRRERHPELRMSLRALMRARMALMHGAHDFGGHRAQALELTNQAIAQVQQSIQSDGN